MDAATSPDRTAQNGRAYRSKKQRPCDICRVRRVQCKSLPQAVGGGHDGRFGRHDRPLCQMCAKLGLHCTFVQGPPRKRCRDAAERGAAIATVASPSIAPSDIPPTATSPNGNAIGPVSPHAIAMDSMDIAPFWLASAMPSGSRIVTGETTTTAMEPDPLMDWWSPMEMPHVHPAISPTEANTLLPDRRRANSANADHDALIPGDRISRHSSPASRMASTSAWPREFSLESWPGHSNQWLGLSGESDPYFLRHYAYNEYDTYPMFRLHYRKLVDDATLVRPPTAPGAYPPPPPASPMPVQFVIADEAIWRDDVRAVEGLFLGNSTEATDTKRMATLVPPELAARLVTLYTQFVHPRYPVLSLRDLERMSGHPQEQADESTPADNTDDADDDDDAVHQQPSPKTPTGLRPREGGPSGHGTTPARPDGSLAFPVGLRCAVYALAAPFAFLDDQLSVSRGYREGSAPDELWAIAHRSFQRASRLAHVSSLQLCLLLLQQPPQSDVAAEPPSFWALSCTALAVAENLGLGMDPDAWRLPRAEAMLRRRLWWLLHTTHVWTALVCGRPSHIHRDDWEVALLRPDDFEGDGTQTQAQQVAICMATCELGLIAADVLQEFYTLRGTRRTPSTLSSLLARAQPLRTRIVAWRQTLPLLCKPASDLTEAEFDSGAALRLSHLTLELLIFRALLRPLTLDAVLPADRGREPISTIFDNGYACVKAVAGMVSSLQARHFATFWPPYVRHQLCYVATFVLMNLAQSSTHAMAARYLDLLDQWRRTLRIQAHAWPLARLAAMRLDAITWKGVSTVVHGAGPDSPAMAVLRQRQS